MKTQKLRTLWMDSAITMMSLFGRIHTLCHAHYKAVRQIMLIPYDVDKTVRLVWLFCQFRSI